MHPDTKLGLALGMLVTGFAIAFCFPREPRTSPIAELTRERDATAAPIEPIRFAVGELENFRSETSRPVISPVEPLAPPEPLPTSAHPVLRPLPAVAVEGQSGMVQSPETLPNHSSSSSPAEPAASYRVQSGDTLSGIAARFLGSSQRYYEIYAANRDQLLTPNDLKAGMTLRIPGSNSSGPVSAPQHGSPGGANYQPLVSTDEPQPTLAIPNRHVVKPGETLESIAERYFGDRSYATVLRAANPQLAGVELLRVGTVIELPVLR